MKKLLLVVLAIFAFGLVACGRDSGSDEVPTIVLSRWAGDHADVQNIVVRSFEGADIVIDDIDYHHLRERQIRSMSVSAEYDLVWVAETWLPVFVENGWLLSLDDFIARDGVNMRDFSSSIVEINTIDGNLYAMPNFLQGLFLAYNSEWFAREGQSVPTTMDELLAVARHFREQGYGIAMPAMQGQASMDLFSTILYSAGGDYFDANGNLNLLSEEVLYAAYIYRRLVDYSMPGSTAWHHDQVAQSIRTEAAPFGFMVSGLAGLNADPDVSLIVDTVGYAVIPGRNVVAGVVSTWSWAIPANSENPEAAWEVLKWLTGAEAEREMALRIGHTSAYSGLANDPEVIEAVPFLPTLLAQMENGRTQPIDPAAAELTDPFIAALSTIATTNTPPEQILEELQERFGHIRIGQ